MATFTKRGKNWLVQVRRKGYTPQTRTFSTKAAAEVWAREQEGRIDRALAPTNIRLLKNTALRDVLDRYLKEVTPTKRSQYSETARLKKVLREQVFCNLALTDLTPKVFADYRTMRLEVVKPGTVHRELGLIRHALEVARREWDMDLSCLSHQI